MKRAPGFLTEIDFFQSECVIQVKHIHLGLMQLKSASGISAMLSRFTIKRAKHYALNWFNCLIVCVFLGKVGQVLFESRCEIDAVMERKDSNCVGILSDQGEAETASNLREHNMLPRNHSLDTHFVANI